MRWFRHPLPHRVTLLRNSSPVCSQSKDQVRYTPPACCRSGFRLTRWGCLQFAFAPEFGKWKLCAARPSWFGLWCDTGGLTVPLCGLHSRVQCCTCKPWGRCCAFRLAGLICAKAWSTPSYSYLWCRWGWFQTPNSRRAVSRTLTPKKSRFPGQDRSKTPSKSFVLIFCSSWSRTVKTARGL
jgi:hypothetical protein